MALFRRLIALGAAAELARRYARSNPDKAGRYIDQAADFVDKQTKGKYASQIKGATDKAKEAAGIPHGGHGTGTPGQHPANGQATGYGQPGHPDPQRPAPPTQHPGT